MIRPRELVTAGWREWISLPDLNLGPIKAKLDTGARTSALHAYDLEPFEVDGVRMIRFSVHPNQRDSDSHLRCEAPLVEHRSVRSSTGHSQHRPVIRTGLRIAGRTVRTEVTLSDRSLMGFRVLVGRKALRRKFLVDSGSSFMHGQ